VTEKKKITVLLGGTSAEREVSLDSGYACSKALQELGYNVSLFDPKEQKLENVSLQNPDVIFNALHGRFGEDGTAQTTLEYLRIPYTHSGILASAFAMDKLLSKKIFINEKIHTPKYEIIKSINDYKVSKISYPKVIKPHNEGSSVGVYILKEKNNSNEKIVNELLVKYNLLILEEFISGREIQVAVMGDKAIGAIEIVPKREFYDYEAKYSDTAGTKHIIPVDIESTDYELLLKLALRAHKSLGCRGVTRSDFRYSSHMDEKFFILEVNTQPGMTKLSLVPEIANFHGINFKQLVQWIINDASTDR